MVDEDKRLENAVFLNRYMSVILGVAGSYVCGYGAHIMNSDMHVNSVIDAGLKVVENIKELNFFYPYSPSVLAGWAMGIGVGAMSYMILANDTQRHLVTNMRTAAGSGGFMTTKAFNDYKKKYIHEDPAPLIDEPIEISRDYEEEKNKYSRNMIMTNKFSRPIDSRELIGNNNVLVVGGAGTGKSRFFIKPNVLQMNASYIISDPSGEIINSTGKVLAAHGYKIKILNISDMKHSNTYNPLAYIRDEAGVNKVVTCLIDNTTKGEVGGDNQFFVDAEKLLYSACIFYLLDFCNDETKKNFAGVMDLILAAQVDEANDKYKSPFDELFDKLPRNSLAWRYYSSFKKAAGKTLKSILISCVTRLQPFLIPQVRNLTNTDELEMDTMGDEKTALFLIIPQADKTYSFITSMLYYQFFETSYFKGEQQLADGGSEQMKIPIRCLMDEFRNTGIVPDFPSRLSTMRKYNISATIVLQDLSQIETMYKEEHKSLIGNCSSILFLGSSELDTLKTFSEKLDKRTVKTRSTGETKGSRGSSNANYQHVAREVMTIAELGELDEHDCIIFTQNKKPFRDKKYIYENHPYYPCTADADKKNAFMYKSMAIYNNEENIHINSILKAKNAMAKLARYKEHEKLMAERSENPNILVNNLNLGEETEAALLNEMIINCRNEAEKIEENQYCVIKDTDTPSKFLINVAESITELTARKELIVFGGMESSSNVLIGIGYSKEGDKRRLRKVMNNEYALKCEESTNHVGVIITAIKCEDYSSYIKEVNRINTTLDAHKE